MTRLGELLRRAVVPALALVTAFLLGAMLIVLTDFEHLQHIGSDPGAALSGAISGVFKGYGAIVSGAIGDPGRIVAAIQTGNPAAIASAIWPLSETLVSATPFIFVGLALAVSFHAGLSISEPTASSSSAASARRSPRASCRASCRHSPSWSSHW